MPTCKAPEMKFFSPIVDIARSGRDWGVDAAKNVYNAAATKLDSAGKQLASIPGQLVDSGRAKIHQTVREQVAKAVKNTDLLNRGDMRDRYSAKMLEQCTGSGPPVPYDGQYLGKDCDHPTTAKPAKGEGHKPVGCENCGKEFPQTVFTNGIDNTRGEACATLQQLSDALCLEVVGIYNASYKSAVPPARSAEDNMALLNASKEGLKSGAVKGFEDALPMAILLAPKTGGVGAAVSLATGAGKGAVKDGAIKVGLELVAQEVPRLAPQTQDMLDTIDTLANRSRQPATQTMAEDIADSLRQGKPVNIIGHSEGGVNTVAVIGDAKKMLEDERQVELSLVVPKLSFADAQLKASRDVEAAMAEMMTVTLLGTQQTGLPTGPNYIRVAHKSDLVPDAIAGALDGIGRPGHNQEPTSLGKLSPPVERFPIIDKNGNQLGPATLNPLTAHNMEKSYIPYLRDKLGRNQGAPCC